MSAAAHTGIRRLVRCSAGSETYCMDQDWLDSVQVMENLYPSPGADNSIGWIRRFDEKVPVYRLAGQINSEASHRSSGRGVIMVLRKNGRQWALLVDKVTAGGDVAADRIFPLPELAGDAAAAQFPGVVLSEPGTDEEEISLYLAPDRMTGGSAAAIPRPAPAVVGPMPVSRLRQSIAAHTEGSKAGGQIITFTLRHEPALASPVRFAVSTTQAVAIVSELPVVRVPLAPPFMLGVANWRSLPIPVVDVAVWLGITTAPIASRRRLLVCRGTTAQTERNPALFAIAGVDEVRKLDLPVEYTPWPEAVSWNESLALGIYRSERVMLVVPDLDAIFVPGSAGTRGCN